MHPRDAPRARAEAVVSRARALLARSTMAGTRLTGWRKIAATFWDSPSDPQIYGSLDLDATAVLEFIRRARALGHHVTPTHLVGRAVAMALRAAPDLNVRLLAGRAYDRRGADVFFITSVAKGKDLTGVKVEHADRKSAAEIAKELGARASRMREGRDPDFAKSKRAMELLPPKLLRLALRFATWLSEDHDTAVPFIGLAASPFGSAMVSSVGMLGLPMGFAPLAWLYRVSMLVLVGEIADKPVAIDGRVEIRPMLPISATIDHRYVDGAQIAVALKAFKAYLADPASYEELPDAPLGDGLRTA